MHTRTERIPVADGEAVVLDWWEPDRIANGRCLLFLHGMGSHRRGEKAIHFGTQFCARGWHYGAVDLRGHGDADGRMRDLTLTRCLRDVDAVLQRIPDGLAPPALIGSSMGGAVAAWHKVTRPGRTGPVTMIAPALTWPARFATETPPEELERWQREGVLHLHNEWMDIELGYALVEDGRQYPVEALYERYHAPTLILHGMQDDSVPWQQSMRFVEAVGETDVKLLLLKDGDHRLTDHKAYLFDAIAAWLG